MTTRHPYRRFLRTAGVLLMIYLLLAVVLTTTVDPWRAVGAPWAAESLDAARDIHGEMRVGKAALAGRGTWEAVILGSSRFEIALDPGHPAFRGMRCANLALSGASLWEICEVGEYTLRRNPELRRIILGVDPGDLHNAADSRRDNNYALSPFADDGHSIERTISQLVGAEAFGASLDTLRRHFRHQTGIYSPLGRMVDPPDHGGLRRFVEGHFPDSPVVQWETEPLVLRKDKAEALQHLLEHARRAGIAVTVAVPPQHALKQIHPVENAPRTIAWQTDLEALADICRAANRTAAMGPPVQLWSFLTFNRFTTTPLPPPDDRDARMPGWFDLGHCGRELGDEVLRTLLDNDAAERGIGLLLVPGDSAAPRAGWLADHAAYCAAHAADAAWWRGLSTRSGKPREN